MVKTDAITQQRILNIISNIPEENLKAYAGILYWTACRAGEILPYQHYKIHYKKDEQNKLVYGETGNPIVEKKEKANLTWGINVEDIDILPDKIHFKKIPVFKTRGESWKEGIIWKSNTRLYEHLLKYVKERIDFKEKLRLEGNQKSIFLFEAESEEDIEKFVWRFTKRLYLALKKVDPTFKIHTLRVSRATVAGDASGDAFYVRSITGHRSIQMAADYTKSKNFMEKAEKYEGKGNEVVM